MRSIGGFACALLVVLHALLFLDVSFGFHRPQFHRVPTKTKLRQSTTSSETAKEESLFETALLETFSSERLKGLAKKYVQEFQSKTPFPHIYIDNLFKEYR